VDDDRVSSQLLIFARSSIVNQAVLFGILPVSSQHRGRIFLPFVDDDPKTAKIMSKVLLLAKDKEIQDPTILEQILAK
jgi:hypothetical protein